MTPENQVKEIIKLLSPEDPANQTDAVFLVQRFITRFNEVVGGKEKQIALLEAELEKRSKEKHDIVNEKLASEAKLKGELKAALGSKEADKSAKPGRTL